MKNNTNSILDDIFQTFPALKNAGHQVRAEILEHATTVNLPKGEMILLEGDECKNMGLILSGTIRIYKAAESGREITLYRLGAGESCVLSASCIFSRNSFPAIAVTEEKIEMVTIPSNIFRKWIDQHDIWRNYVFGIFSKRLSDVIETLEEVTFSRMDVRIAEFLINLAGPDHNDIKITHQDIAMELGTSREVISRILKNFETEKIISLKRGTITINNPDLLRNRSDRS